MAMNVGSVGHGPKADINVTPLIDIVLVLLIIFMVLTPMMQRGYDLNIPEKSNEPPPPGAVAEQLVLVVTADGRIQLNKEDMTPEGLMSKLQEALATRAEKIVFFDGDDDADYQKVVTVLDIVKAAGGTPGLVTTRLGG